MATFFDDLTVGVLLLASVMYAAYALGPKVLRRRLSTLGGSLLPGRLGRRLQLAAAKGGGSCGGCESCGSAEKPIASVTLEAKAGEVRVPLSQVTRRAGR